MSAKRKCFYCGREIAENVITGRLRWHKWPRGLEFLYGWQQPGDACLGVGSRGSDL